ncbi:MAG: hypothetical protein RLZ98_3258 [Pseudomonadota bacterium]
MTAADDGEVLSLRPRVEDLYARYAHCLDDDELEEWPEFFTEKAVYRVATRENFSAGLPLSVLYCDGRAMMADRISAMRTANIYEPQVYCHLLSAVRLTGRDGDGWKARANFAVVRTMVEGDMMVFAAGRSFDRIVEEGGRLRFAERTLVLDSRSIDTLLVIPL